MNLLMSNQRFWSCLGKAFGMSGAAILCDQATGDFLTQFARHHVYSTAMPPAQAYALTHAVSMIQEQSWRREKLVELNEVYQTNLSDLDGFVETDTPIKPFVIGDPELALQVANACRQMAYGSPRFVHQPFRKVPHAFVSRSLRTIVQNKLKRFQSH